MTARSILYAPIPRVSLQRVGYGCDVLQLPAAQQQAPSLEYDVLRS